MSINLEHIVGFRVKVTNLLKETTEGKIYSFNSGNNTITLQTSKKTQPPYSFKVIKCSFISSLEVIGEKPAANSFKRQNIKPSFVNIQRVDAALDTALVKAKKEDALRGKGVSPEGQAIFNLIYKTVPDTRWVGKDIVILDDIRILPPYKVENIVHNLESHSVKLIVKIVEKGWKRIEENAGGRKGG